MSSEKLYKTGEESAIDAEYQWVKYTDGTISPSPTSEEEYITLDKGDEFPPIRSCNKGAWWRLVAYR